MADAEGQNNEKTVAHAIDQAGWEQFSFFGDEDSKAVLGQSSKVEDGTRLIVISNSCDLVHEGPDFPRVEVLEVRVVATPNPELLSIGSPRTIQFETTVSPNSAIVVWQAKVSDRRFIARETLANLQPDKSFSMRTPRDGQGGRSLSSERLSGWLARHYDRPVLPTEFNRRWAPKRVKIRQSIKRLVALKVEELYFLLYPETEIGSADIYELHILAVLPPGTDPTAATGEVGVLAQHVACEGIHVARKSAQAANLIYWSDVRGMTPFDVFAQLSPPD